MNEKEKEEELKNIVNSFSKLVPAFYLDYDLAETSMTNDGRTVTIIYKKMRT